MPKNRPPRRRPTNSRRSHLVSGVLAAVCVVGGLSTIAVGIIAWSTERPAPQQVLAGETTLVGRTPWFDNGTTLFVAPPREGALPGPGALGCTLYGRDGSAPLRTAADADRIGTRVVAQLSLVPSTKVGPTKDTDRILCQGPAMADAVVWLLPTTAGPSRTPLSVVIGGVALLGLAALVDPRARGLRRGLG